MSGTEEEFQQAYAAKIEAQKRYWDALEEKRATVFDLIEKVIFSGGVTPQIQSELSAANAKLDAPWRALREAHQRALDTWRAKVMPPAGATAEGDETKHSNSR